MFVDHSEVKESVPSPADTKSNDRTGYEERGQPQVLSKREACITNGTDEFIIWAPSTQRLLEPPDTEGSADDLEGGGSVNGNVG